MNVIFLDLDGVIDTYYYSNEDQIEEKIKIVADIAKELDCKIVIEAAAKDSMDPQTLEIDGKWLSFVVSTLEKYGAEVIGRTPNVKKYYTEYSYTEMWKEDEIRLYLMLHPEVKHFCIIDDDDLSYRNNSDLNKVREYLVKTLDYNEEDHELEGILPSHKEEIEKILKKENKYKKFAEEYQRRHS